MQVDVSYFLDRPFKPTSGLMRSQLVKRAYTESSIRYFLNKYNFIVFIQYYIVAYVTSVTYR